MGLPCSFSTIISLAVSHSNGCWSANIEAPVLEELTGRQGKKNKLLSHPRWKEKSQRSSTVRLPAQPLLSNKTHPAKLPILIRTSRRESNSVIFTQELRKGQSFQKCCSGFFLVAGRETELVKYGILGNFGTDVCSLVACVFAAHGQAATGPAVPRKRPGPAQQRCFCGHGGCTPRG